MKVQKVIYLTLEGGKWNSQDDGEETLQGNCWVETQSSSEQ